MDHQHLSPAGGGAHMGFRGNGIGGGGKGGRNQSLLFEYKGEV